MGLVVDLGCCCECCPQGLSHEAQGMGAWMWAIGFPHRIDSRGGPQGYLLLVLFVLWFQISLASKGSVYSWYVEVDTHTHLLRNLQPYS